MKLSENFRDLIEKQEVLEASRTRVLMALECGDCVEGTVERKLLLLHMILASQAMIARDLLAESAALTCEGVEWPMEIRA